MQSLPISRERKREDNITLIIFHDLSLKLRRDILFWCHKMYACVSMYILKKKKIIFLYVYINIILLKMSNVIRCNIIAKMLLYYALRNYCYGFK